MCYKGAYLTGEMKMLVRPHVFEKTLSTSAWQLLTATGVEYARYYRTESIHHIFVADI